MRKLLCLIKGYCSSKSTIDSTIAHHLQVTTLYERLHTRMTSMPIYHSTMGRKSRSPTKFDRKFWPIRPVKASFMHDYVTRPQHRRMKRRSMATSSAIQHSIITVEALEDTKEVLAHYLHKTEAQF